MSEIIHLEESSLGDGCCSAGLVDEDIIIRYRDFSHLLAD